MTLDSAITIDAASRESCQPIIVHLMKTAVRFETSYTCGIHYDLRNEEHKARKNLIFKKNFMFKKSLICSITLNIILILSKVDYDVRIIYHKYISRKTYSSIVYK